MKAMESAENYYRQDYENGGEQPVSFSGLGEQNHDAKQKKIYEDAVRIVRKGWNSELDKESMLADLGTISKQCRDNKNIHMDFAPEDIFVSVAEDLYREEGFESEDMRSLYESMALKQAIDQIVKKNSDATSEGYWDKSEDILLLADMLQDMRLGKTHAGIFGKENIDDGEWGALSQKAEHLLALQREAELNTAAEDKE